MSDVLIFGHKNKRIQSNVSLSTKENVIFPWNGNESFLTLQNVSSHTMKNDEKHSNI